MSECQSVSVVMEEQLKCVVVGDGAVGKVKTNISCQKLYFLIIIYFILFFRLLCSFHIPQMLFQVSVLMGVMLLLMV